MAGAAHAQKAPAMASSLPVKPVQAPGTATAPAGEPKELAGILLKQNEVRAKLGLPLLTWSTELADAMRAGIAEATVKSCNVSAVSRLVDAQRLAVYWAAPIRTLTGDSKLQDLKPSFVVSEWSAGKSSYDPATSSCRKGAMAASSCESYSRMVAPSARTVACVRTICPSQGQLWTCAYGPAATPAVKAKP
jgi:hypothetical protein